MKSLKIFSAGLISALVAVSVVGGAATAAGAAERTFLNIGTAGIGGGFYPSGGYLCRMIDKTSKEMGKNIRCTVESTAGSVANLRSLRVGDLEVAFAQADWQYNAWHGEKVFKEDGADKELRHLLALHGDILHIVTRKDSGIKNFLDLKGKNVNTGNVGSGTEASIYAAMDYYKLDPKKFFGQETKLSSREQATKLCDGSIDAFIYPGGIGQASMVEAVTTCGATIANWWDETIEKMVKDIPYLNPAVIPANSYQGQTEPVKSFGWSVTLATTSRLPEEVGYIIAKSLFDNFEEFKSQSPMYAAITPEGCATYGQSAPYHPGALRFYKEAGLVK